MTIKSRKPATFIFWGLYISLLIGIGFAAYFMFYPGAVFIFVALLEFILLAGTVIVFFIWRSGSRWWIPALCIIGILFLYILASGGTRLAQSMYWINHNPDVYEEGRIVDGRAGGTASLDPGIVERSRPAVLKMAFRVGDEGVGQGGGIILRLGEIIPIGGKPRFYDCSYQDMFSETLQVSNPSGQGYVSVSAPPGVKISLGKPDAPDPRDFLLNAFVANVGKYRTDLRVPLYYQPNIALRHEIHCKVEEGSLKPGETVELTLGDRSHGGPGWKMPDGEAGADLVLYVDSSGDGLYRMAAYSTLEVGGGEAAALQVIAPSTPALGEDFTFVVKAVDDQGFPAMLYRGTVSILPQEGIDCAAGSYVFKQGDRGAATFKARVTLPGTYRIAVRQDSPGRVYDSNPLLVGEVAGLHIYWGDLHQHTTLGKDANRTPEWVFQRNRDVDLLDYAALSIHDLFEYWGLPPDTGELAYLRQVTDKYNEVGRFVTLNGYEWSSLPQGHRNIYYTAGEDPVMFPYDLIEDPGALRTALEGSKYMVIPHHPAWRFLHSGIPFNWGGRDWEQERLVEIYSKHGSSDYYEGPYPIHHDFTPFFIYLLGGNSNRAHKGDGSYVREALADGYRLGIVAGGDNHWAIGGKSFGSNITRDYRPGLQATYAPELTRLGLYKAMWERYTYGTTGARIIIDFKVNGYPMGSETAADSRSQPTVYYMVKGTAPVKSIEVWKYSKSKGYELFEFDGKGKNDVQGQFSDDGFSQDSLYFMKVVQEDGNLAWSSPVWVRE
jgi:hypothetical protein